MSWETVYGKKSMLEIISLGKSANCISYIEYDPNKKLSVDIINRLEDLKKGSTIIVPYTFEILKTKTNIPYEVTGSTEKGIIELLSVHVRNNKIINKIWVKPTDRDGRQILDRDLNYSLSGQHCLSLSISPDKMMVPSTSQGIFNEKIEMHLIRLARDNLAIRSDLGLCIDYMRKEAGM